MPGRPEQVRYGKTVEPVQTDGRDIDTSIAVLSGEGAGQEAKGEREQVQKLAPKLWERIPSVDEEAPTYYDRPLLKESVWSIDIPLYYFTGGAAGAALALGAALQLACPHIACDRDLRAFAKHCHWVGIIGSTTGAALLIHDLGRPSRFLHMVRVFRPTSPMNMGSWILGGAAPTAIATGLFLNRPGLIGLAGEAAGYASGVFGAALATYTGVLVSNTAIPVWQEARRWMPVLFAASSMASAAGLLDLFYEGKRANQVTRVFGGVGRVAEIAAARAVQRAASRVPQVGEPFRRGAASKLWKASAALTAASVAITWLPGRSAAKRRTAGALSAVGSLCLRFAVHYIGNASARDPRASFQLQRAAATSTP